METAYLAAFRTWLLAQPSLTGVPIDLGPMQEGSDKRIALMDYPGPPGPNWQGNYRVQIRVRGRPEAAGVSPYKDAHDLADAVISVVAPPGDNRVVAQLNNKPAVLWLVSGPLSMGPDAKGRWEFTVNVALEMSRV